MYRSAIRCLVRSFLVVAMAVLPTTLQAQPAVLHARTNLVLVPTLVESKFGEPVFNLSAQDFIVKDNGVEQKIHLDPDMDKAPTSIVVLVQVGRSAVREFHKMAGLPTMLNALAGNARHRVAVVEFDSRPRTLLDFSGDPDAVEHAVYSIQLGDDEAAILDAVWYAVDMLEDEPKQNQRVIILLSETRDHGSVTPTKEVVRKVSSGNVVVYSLAFSPARSDLFDFSGAGGDANLLPLLRMTIAALRKNTAEAIPQMTGGEYLRFNGGKQLDNEMGMLANQVHNRYILSFQPSDPRPGLHVLTMDLRRPLQARVLARTSYWATGQPDISGEETTQPGLPLPHGSPQN